MRQLTQVIIVGCGAHRRRLGACLICCRPARFDDAEYVEALGGKHRLQAVFEGAHRILKNRMGPHKFLVAVAHAARPLR